MRVIYFHQKKGKTNSTFFFIKFMSWFQVRTYIHVSSNDLLVSIAEVMTLRPCLNDNAFKQPNNPYSNLQTDIINVQPSLWINKAKYVNYVVKPNKVNSTKLRILNPEKFGSGQATIASLICTANSHIAYLQWGFGHGAHKADIWNTMKHFHAKFDYTVIGLSHNNTVP